jgi:5-aminolevulinate synthase
MFDYHNFLTEKLQTLRRERRYRRFRVLEREAGHFPYAKFVAEDGRTKDVAVWCSNDYLGMSQHPVVLEAAKQALSRYGAGAGGTRNISGTHELLVALEAELASLHTKPGALVFTSGYVANDTTLATLGRHLPECTFYSDANNHASMVEGMRRSGARCEVFAHNDPQSLERLLARGNPEGARIVAFESLYSMDGDIAPILQLLSVARRHGALTYVDETHAVGVHGPGGAGLVAAAGVLDQVDLLQGGLGKGYGAVGGFVTANTAMIDFLRSYAPGFIFTTALPPSVVAGALASVRHLRRSEQERQRLFDNVRHLRSELMASDMALLKTSTQILPLIVGDAANCEHIANRLIERQQIYLQAINYPTVPRGTERFRITPTALHSSVMAEHLVTALSAEFKNLDKACAA